VLVGRRGRGRAAKHETNTCSGEEYGGCKSSTHRGHPEGDAREANTFLGI